MQYKWVALTVTTVGTLMYAIDDRILVIGLPTLAREIGANVTEAIWVTQAYVLAATISLLLIGRLADVAGRVKLYNIGFIIFTIGSALAAISFTPAELIASRLVQGLGASAIAANGLAILTDATPENELGTFIGYNQVAFRSGHCNGASAFRGLAFYPLKLARPLLHQLFNRDIRHALGSLQAQGSLED